MVCRYDLVLLSIQFKDETPSEPDSVHISFIDAGGKPYKLNLHRENDWWVFKAPFIIKWLPYTQCQLYVNNSLYSGKATTKWITFPMRDFVNDETYIQSIGNNEYMSYLNGCGQILSESDIRSQPILLKYAPANLREAPTALV